MSDRPLTPKQELFAQEYVKTSNQSEAYRKAYNIKKAKPATINRSAKTVYDNPKVRARIRQLRKTIAKRQALTVDDLIAELEEARKIAIAKENVVAMISATMGKAKLTGLDQGDQGSQEEAEPLAYTFTVSASKSGVKVTNAAP